MQEKLLTASPGEARLQQEILPLYVGPVKVNPPPTEEDVKSLFKNHNIELKEVRVVQDAGKTNRGRGCVFVDFHDADSREKALNLKKIEAPNIAQQNGELKIEEPHSDEMRAAQKDKSRKEATKTKNDLTKKHVLHANKCSRMKKTTEIKKEVKSASTNRCIQQRAVPDGTKEAPDIAQANGVLKKAEQDSELVRAAKQRQVKKNKVQNQRLCRQKTCVTPTHATQGRSTNPPLCWSPWPTNPPLYWSPWQQQQPWQQPVQPLWQHPWPQTQLLQPLWQQVGGAGGAAVSAAGTGDSRHAPVGAPAAADAAAAAAPLAADAAVEAPLAADWRSRSSCRRSS